MDRTWELFALAVGLAFYAGIALAMMTMGARLVASLHEPLAAQPLSPPPSLVHLILRNGAGVVLIVFGVAMLVLPGPGILTLAIGVSILDLPIKRRLLARLRRAPSIRKLLEHTKP